MSFHPCTLSLVPNASKYRGSGNQDSVGCRDRDLAVLLLAILAHRGREGRQLEGARPGSARRKVAKWYGCVRRTRRTRAKFLEFSQGGRRVLIFEPKVGILKWDMGCLEDTMFRRTGSVGGKRGGS